MVSPPKKAINIMPNGRRRMDFRKMPPAPLVVLCHLA